MCHHFEKDAGLTCPRRHAEQQALARPSYHPSISHIVSQYRLVQITLMLITFRFSTRLGWSSRGDLRGRASCVLYYGILKFGTLIRQCRISHGGDFCSFSNSQIPWSRFFREAVQVEFRKQIIMPRHRSVPYEAQTPWNTAVGPKHRLDMYCYSHGS